MTLSTGQDGLPTRSGGDESESWRLECEAREWLRRAGRDPVKIRERLASIANRRGQAAADELAAAMRIEWRKNPGTGA